MRTDTEIMNQQKADVIACYTNWRAVDPKTMMPEWTHEHGRHAYEQLCGWMHDDTMPKPRDIIAASLGPDKRPAGPWLLSGVIKKN